MAGRTETAPLPETDPAGGPSGRPHMLRAAWRQHRLWVIGTVALVAVGAVVLATAVALIPACASTPWWEKPGEKCDLEPTRMLWRLFRVAMAALPILTGVVLGAVTFGPDVEHRTQVYALTQGVDRLRWWAVKALTVSAPVFAAAALLGMATLWVVDTSDVLSTNRLTSPGFDVLGLIPATRFLVAYTAAAAAAVLWRTVGGIVAGLLIAVVVVVGSGMLQPVVVLHNRDIVPIRPWLAGQTAALMSDPKSAYGWGGYADSDGREVDTTTFDCGQMTFSDCVVAQGVTYRIETYVADSQYPRMMLIISSLNLLISGGLLGLGCWTLRRRDL